MPRGLRGTAKLSQPVRLITINFERKDASPRSSRLRPPETACLSLPSIFRPPIAESSDVISTANLSSMIWWILRHIGNKSSILGQTIPVHRLTYIQNASYPRTLVNLHGCNDGVGRGSTAGRAWVVPRSPESSLDK